MRAHDRAWLAVEWALLAVWVTAAALVMLHLRGGFLTDHAADLTVPAWMYVALRRARPRGNFLWRRALAESPASLASVLFLASAATEVSQRFWPRGPFPGRFDPLDVVAYGAGLAAVYLADLRWPVRGATGPTPASTPSATL